MLRYPQIECPYCGEPQSLVIDCSSEVQYYYEDCRICCQSMAVSVTCSYEGELLSLDIVSESEVTGF